MKKIILPIALAIAAIGTVHAQTAPAQPARFFVGTGLTFGGDKLATAHYERFGDYDVQAGGLVAFTAGVDYTVNPQFSLQASVGYHVDQASARNGDIRFERFPIEVLAYYHPATQWRVGGGARYAANPKLSSSGVADFGDYEFDNSVGGVLEAEYRLNPRVGFKLRYVVEKFELEGYRGDIDGKHVGIFANWYF